MDYTHDSDSLLFVWKELEPKCSFLDPAPSPYPPAHYPPEGKPYARPDKPYYHEITVPDLIKPGPSPPFSPPWSLSPGNPAHDPNYGERFLFPLIPDELSIFKRYTVNGQPCKRGTRCERNTVAGFWSCEPEGAEPGGWDYCCEPSHHCGFSQGYNYQWCYVGASEDQWRPCSEKYYPYQSNPRPVRPRPPYNRADNDDNYHSRHWPVTYLHGEAPPNGTDSVALANDVTDRTLNESTTPEPTTTPKPLQVTKNETNSMLNTNQNKRRGIVAPPSLKIRRKEAALMTLNNRLNTTSEKSARINSRFKPFNSSLEYSPRFSRDDSNGQYYITKKLNAQLNGERSKAVAKIERISRITDDLPGNETIPERHFVAIATNKGPTTMRTMRIVIPGVSLSVSNDSRNDNVTGQWEKIVTIDRGN